MIKLAFFSATALVFIGCGGNSTPPVVNQTSQAHDSLTIETSQTYDSPTIDNTIKQAYLDAINNERATSQECGNKGTKPAAPALTWNDDLYKAAYEHSEDMAESNTFSHVGSGTASDWTAQIINLERGSTLKERVENNGYINWKTIGENIAKGQTSVEQVVASWMESPGHCANIMNPKYTEIGMARVENYWTQKFGAR